MNGNSPNNLSKNTLKLNSKKPNAFLFVKISYASTNAKSQGMI